MSFSWNAKSSQSQPNKRRRDSSDVGISKNEYNASQSYNSGTPGNFSKASPNSLAQRKQVSIPSPQNLTSALHSATKDLNLSFISNLREKFKNKNNEMENTWESSLKDYVTYARHIKTHYRRRGGLVLACGSNDCGQTGHGRDAEGCPHEPNGLAVVESLRHVDIRYVGK